MSCHSLQYLPNKEAKAPKYLCSTTHRLDITLDIRIYKPESSGDWENRISMSKLLSEMQFIVPIQQSGLTKHKKLSLAWVLYVFTAQPL